MTSPRGARCRCFRPRSSLASCQSSISIRPSSSSECKTDRSLFDGLKTNQLALPRQGSPNRDRRGTGVGGGRPGREVDGCYYQRRSHRAGLMDSLIERGSQRPDGGRPKGISMTDISFCCSLCVTFGRLAVGPDRRTRLYCFHWSDCLQIRGKGKDTDLSVESPFRRAFVTI